MTGISPLILSIAMLAAFGLAAGGVWLLVKQRDRKQSVLMIVAALVLLANVLIWAVPVKAAPPLPRDVSAFLARRDSCEHWLGEEPYDAARRAEINRALRASCSGNDRQLAQLKRRYARRHDVQRVLALPPVG